MSPSLRFDDGVSHRRLDLADWDDVYVVGDVHGCRRELDALVERLGVTADDLLVFVGDLVRKGPDNRGVVDFVREAPNAVSVRGNNEEKLLRGEASLDDLDDDDVTWIASLPVAVSWEGALVVHGGVDPRKPLADHSVDDLQNTRSLASAGGYDRPFWFEEYDGPETVFFGHTPLAAPAAHDRAIGLDTGCVYGGALTAYDWYRDAFVRVDTDRTVQERADSKFVEPRETPPLPVP
jgi:serine/threonine protein phosphatase 1